MPSTAWTKPSSVWKPTRRSLTSRSAISEVPLVADPRVEEGVEDVHDQAHHADPEREEEHRALDDGQVVALDGVIRQPAYPGDVEDGLGENRAAHEHADVDAEDGDDRRHRAARRMADDHPPVLQPLGPGCSYVVLGEDLDHVAAHEPRVDRGECRGQH